MPQYFFYNGDWLPEGQPIIVSANRGFRYGDGLFETLCVANGAIRLAGFHFERLFAGLQQLQLQLPPHVDTTYLSAQIATLCRKNTHPTARVRLTVFRGNGNLFDDPAATPPGILIESQPLTLPGSPFQTPGSGLPTPDSGLLTGIFPSARKTADAFSHIKSNNYQASAMAALHARANGLDDVFLLNAAGRVCESAIANVFILRQGRAFTPPLTEGCVAGVMRRFMLEQLPAAGCPVEEMPVTVAHLLEADEVFLTNALRLLRSVGRCDNTQYSTVRSAQLFEVLKGKWENTGQLCG
ncbi:MAG TPA: aminotransferase class IV [Chitinophagaceae bacterium]|nr:aminotransferase class IV [Chitinophagaceae bacterium]